METRDQSRCRSKTWNCDDTPAGAPKLCASFSNSMLTGSVQLGRAKGTVQTVYALRGHLD